MQTRETTTAGRLTFGERGRPADRGGAVDVRTLAEVLAIFAVDLVEILPVRNRAASLERLANRLDEQGQTPGGSRTAGILSAIGEALMQLEG